MEAEDDFERVISEMAELLVPHTPTTAHFKLHTRPPGSSTVVIVDDYLSIQTTESLEDVHTHTSSYTKKHWVKAVISVILKTGLWMIITSTNPKSF